MREKNREKREAEEKKGSRVKLCKTLRKNRVKKSAKNHGKGKKSRSG